MEDKGYFPTKNIDKQSLSSARMIFFDNLRYLMVIFVVVLHSAQTYSNIVPWWHVIDSPKSLFFDIFIVIFDLFLMPVLFFVAGYFAVPSLLKRNTGEFLMDKLKRLGIPLLFVGIFLAPIMPYIRHVNYAGINHIGFFSYWGNQMKTIFDLRFIHIADLTKAAIYMDDFIQHHLWFISLLLIFNIIFASAAAIKTRLRKAKTQIKNDIRLQDSNSMMISLLFFGLGISFCFSVLNLISPDWAWVKIGGLLLFQPVRLPIYAGLFCMGVYAFSKKWFVQRPMPGKIRHWLILTLILMLILITGGKIVEIKNPFGLAVANGLLRTFIAISCICLFIAWAHKYWNRSSTVNRSLATSSYDIYLIHLPIVVVMQYIFLAFKFSIFLKFGFVSVLSLLISWGISRYLIGPHPKLSIAILLVIFICIAVFAK